MSLPVVSPKSPAPRRCALGGQPGLQRSRSTPANLDTFSRAPLKPQFPAFETVLLGFQELLDQAQRPLTPEDRERARRRPVCGAKAMDDFMFFGFEAQHRRAGRHERAGDHARGARCRAAGFVQGVPFALTMGFAGLASICGRRLAQRLSGSKFRKERTEGGVREDLILESMHVLETRLEGPLDWIFADRDPHVPMVRSDVHRLLETIDQVEAALEHYARTHPDPRVRHSYCVQEGMRLMHVTLRRFHGRMVEIASGTTPMPRWQRPELLPPPRPKHRAWGEVEYRL